MRVPGLGGGPGPTGEEKVAVCGVSCAARWAVVTDSGVWRTRACPGVPGDKSLGPVSDNKTST